VTQREEEIDDEEVDEDERRPDLRRRRDQCGRKKMR
jgi:hypothetical protein